MNDTSTGEERGRSAEVDHRSIQIQDALRHFFRPTRTGDSKTDFYFAYQKEATEYDHFVEQYDEYLNTSLIFAGLFSAVCAAFVIELQRKLEPDQAAYLQAILQTLQNPNSTVASSPFVAGSPSTRVTVSVLLYTSLSTSLLAAFLAMLGKQWLHRYTRHKGGSAAERCGDRQRKLDGLERWKFRIVIESPSVLLQLSLLLLVVGLSRSLWDINRTVAWVVVGFTIFGALLYVVIVVIGTFSYECPFQTPLSRFFRGLGVNRPTTFPRPGEPDPGAGCIFWALNYITNSEMTTAALRYLMDIRWHFNPSGQVPLLQVARIYMKCFNASNHLISEYRDLAQAAGQALIQLYVHRMCSGGASDHKHQVVTDALDHLSDRQRDNALQPLSRVVKNIRESSWSPEYRWEMGHFDLPWISELWMYHAWFRRTQVKGHRVGGIITERDSLATIAMLFKSERSPPPSAVRNILYGLLAGVSSSALPLDDLLGLQRGESTEELFRRLQAEMTELAGHDLPTLQVTLEAFMSWEHNRMEIVELCCDLLQYVTKFMAKHALLRRVVCLLCRIAFHHPIPSIKMPTEIMKPETLTTLLTFIQGEDVELIGGLMSAFASISWSEESEDRILQKILDIPALALSPSSQAAIVNVLGTARWSLVEGLHRGKLVDLVRGLPTHTIVQQIVDDQIACVGWMRLLLFSTFYMPQEMDARPLLNIILSALPKVPHFFSHGLLNLTPNLDNSQGPKIGKKQEESLWMMLFWSSRFFEMECGSWSDFIDATGRLTEGREVFFRRLEELCSDREIESQDDLNPATKRSKACTEMTKLRAARPPDPSMVAPKDTPPVNKDAHPVNPTAHRQNSILSRFQDNLPPSPTTSSGPPPSQERSESPLPMKDDDSKPPPPTQSGSGISEPTDAGAQPTRTPTPPDMFGAPSGDGSQPAESMHHQVEAGCLWDRDNWSCSYDSVFMSFWYIYRNSSSEWRNRWRQQAPEWNKFFGEAFDSLLEMGQGEQSSQEELSHKFTTFRETFRDNLSRMDSMSFPRQGRVLASVCRIFNYIFTPPDLCEPHLNQVRVCDQCHVQTTVQCPFVLLGTSALLDVYRHEGDTGPFLSLQDAVTRYIQRVSREPQTNCTCSGQPRVESLSMPEITWLWIELDEDAVSPITPSLHLVFDLDQPQVYALQAVIYLGDSRHTARLRLLGQPTTWWKYDGGAPRVDHIEREVDLLENDNRRAVFLVYCRVDS